MAEKGKKVRIVWDEGDDIPIRYANQLFVSHSGETEFHLTFGHIVPPNTSNLTEEELPDRIQVRTVTRLVVSPDAMREIVQVLSGNLDKYDEKR